MPVVEEGTVRERRIIVRGLHHGILVLSLGDWSRGCRYVGIGVIAERVVLCGFVWVEWPMGRTAHGAIQTEGTDKRRKG